MTLSGRQLRHLVLCAILSTTVLTPAISFGSKHGHQGKIMTPSELDSQRRFNSLLLARDDEFERQRTAFFSSRDAIAYLQQRFQDTDLVTAFVSKQLHLWASEKQAEYVQAEESIAKTATAISERPTRSAVQPRAGVVAASVLEDRADKRAISEYFLLKVLMQPRTSPEWMRESLFVYFASHPVSEPEVWIRAALENTDDSVLTHLADYSLRVTDKTRTLSALNHEHNLALRSKKTLPIQLEKLRKELSESVRKP